MQEHAVVEPCERLRARGSVPVAQGLRPGIPRRAALLFLQSHVQAVVAQPRFGRERGAQRGHNSVPFARERRVPERGPARVHARVVHAHGITAPVDGAHLVERERAARHERLGREQVGAAGKR